MTYNINIDDYIGRWGYSKQYIRNQLAGLKGKSVNVRISSLGGMTDWISASSLLIMVT
jgi:hypothetical protein